MREVLARNEAGGIDKLRVVSVIGGPYDGQDVLIETLETSGYPQKFYMRIDAAESAMYALLSPDSIGYVRTISDE